MKKNKNEAGCDEAGRGCLAGPVFAAAVILPDNFKNELLNDSKKLSEKNRQLLRIIIEREAKSFAVAMLDNHEIDEINILNASIAAMHKAIANLNLQPKHLVIDGNRFKAHATIAHTTVIKGDGIFANIAAASILAKTYRDEYMQTLHQKLPQYDWQTNKGYPTANHRNMIIKYGATDYHRKSFRLLPTQLEKDFESTISKRITTKKKNK
jgi:ribonuclease HII